MSRCSVMMMCVCFVGLCVVLAAQTVSDVTGGGPTSGRGSIEGRVLLTGSDQPVAGAEIYIVNARIPPARTDAHGRFIFERLPTGRYGLVLSPTSGYRARETLIAVGQDQKITEVRLVAYLGATISGRVLDHRDRPLAGLLVSALRHSSSGPRFPPDRGMTGVGRTDDNGEYKLSGLDPGQYALLVETRSSTPSPREWKDEDELPGTEERNVRTYYPNAASVDQAAPIYLEAGQTIEGLDVKVTRRDTFCVRSRLASPGEQKTGPIRVQIVSDSYLGSANLADGEVAAGGLEVCGMPRGSYTLLASSETTEKDALYAAEDFVIGNWSVRLPNVTLRPLVQLHGRLAVDAPASETKPFPSPVSILLRAAGRPTVPQERTSVRVTEPGSFTIPAVLPAQYWFDVRLPLGYYLKAATLDGRDVLREPLYAGGRELHVVLGQDAPRLTIHTVSARNEPISGATILVGLDPLPRPYAPGELSTIICDQNGVATARGIRPGKHRVIVLADALVNPANAVGLFDAHRTKGESIELAAGESRSISLKAVDRKD